MTNTDDFRYKGKPLCAIAKSTLFAVSKQWDTKEDTGKSTVVCQKAPVGPKQYQTVKKIKPVALAIIELRLSEGISQLLQSLENSVK